jgi:AcrR family transcriptional regulator
MTTVTGVTSVPTEPVAEGSRAVERIRDAALHLFAAAGTAATSLRSVAATAGVSLGLVQHHFSTKANLIAAVDEHVLREVDAVMAGDVDDGPGDSISAVGRRVSTLLTDHADVAAYVTRALIDGRPVGVRFFDAMVAAGQERWQQRLDRGEMRPDADMTWAVLNSLVLPLAPLILRSHVERHLQGSLSDPAEVTRWADAVNELLREGLFRRQ